ncbi:hypothetical protein JW826_05120 [Candidatus Woesearchaeota archaeon]|nr:hypothetical protein [Candidatus Woesearchaeota archaeon]
MPKAKITRRKAKHPAKRTAKAVKAGLKNKQAVNRKKAGSLLLLPRRGVNYQASCPCGLKEKLQYGRDEDGTLYEVFSCPKCRNLFTLRFNARLECPTCRGIDLKSYNPHKEQNIEFYKARHRDHQLSKEMLDELTRFWIHIRDKECPKCGKNTLRWTNS